ncbi:MAG: hypothetical protein NVS3B25_13030 [Hymenobacter sp.]
MAHVGVAGQQAFVAPTDQHVDRRGGLSLGQLFEQRRHQNNVADESRLDEERGGRGGGHGGTQK